jgi:hypothetical protein
VRANEVLSFCLGAARATVEGCDNPLAERWHSAQRRRRPADSKSQSHVSKESLAAEIQLSSEAPFFAPQEASSRRRRRRNNVVIIIIDCDCLFVSVITARSQKYIHVRRHSPIAAVSIPQAATTNPTILFPICTLRGPQMITRGEKFRNEIKV